jgi:heptosyltransferase II
MYFTAMNILIRLPNWLGDMVMSTAFVKAVKEQYPDASIDLIAKKGIDQLLDYFPEHNQRYIFSKETHKGLGGVWKFGKEIAKQKKYDLFFCLPDSFSSALMGYATGARQRIGYKKELRSIFLTCSYQKKKNLHRVKEYADILQQFTGQQIEMLSTSLANGTPVSKNDIVININSEADSRRLPKEKAVSIITAVRKATVEKITLVGSNKEKSFTDEVYQLLDNKTNIYNLAGATSLPQLLQLFSETKLMITTDSGPAHLANATGVYTIVLFGAGNENNTAPYNKNSLSILRLGKLSCEPCVSNICKKYGVPECLLQLDETIIVQEALLSLKK